MSVLSRAMSVLSRVELTVCLWPLRNAAKVARWLLLAPVALPARIRHGRRPRRLLVRGLIVSVLSLVVLQLIPGTPAAPADITGLILWFALTGWKDLAPRPDAERPAGDNGRYAPGNRDRRVPAGL